MYFSSFSWSLSTICLARARRAVGILKIKPYLKDDDKNRCFHFAPIQLEHYAPHKNTVSSL